MSSDLNGYFDRFHLLVNERKIPETIQEINEAIDFAWMTLEYYGANLQISHIYVGRDQMFAMRESIPIYARPQVLGGISHVEYMHQRIFELRYEKSHWYIALKKK